MLPRRLLLLAFLIVALAPAFASEPGVFPARTWDIRQIRLGDDYPDPPFYALAQSQDGLIYVGDRRGVLEFDGRLWRRLPLETNSAVNVLGVTRTGALVVGGAETLLVVADPGDPTQIVDVSKSLPQGLLGAGDFWEFAEDAERWCVRSTRLLVCSHGAGFRAFRTDREFGRMFQTDDGILIHVHQVGLSRVTADGPQLVRGGTLFADIGISTLVEFADGTHAAITRRPAGIWEWRDGELPAQTATIDFTQVTPPIGIGQIVAADKLALPEDNGGVAILGRDGRVSDRIEPVDLGVGTGAQALMVDREGALWIAWRSAISRVEYPSRTRVFSLPSDLFGQSMLLTRTSLGLTGFHGGTVLALRQDPGSQRWQFQQHGDTLSSILMVRSINGLDFAGTIKGIWSLQDGGNAIGGDLVFSVSQVVAHPDELWVGLRSGVSRLQRNGKTWDELERSSKVSFDVISILQTEPQTLWLGSMVGRVARVDLGAKSSLADSRIDEYDQAAGLPKATISLEQIGDQTFFWAQDGHFHEFHDGRFLPSTVVPASESGEIFEVKRVDDAQLLISSPNSRLRLLRRDITGFYRHQRRIFDDTSSTRSRTWRRRVRSMSIPTASSGWRRIPRSCASIRRWRCRNRRRSAC
jgi:hypothetical protein